MGSAQIKQHAFKASEKLRLDEAALFEPAQRAGIFAWKKCLIPFVLSRVIVLSILALAPSWHFAGIPAPDGMSYNAYSAPSFSDLAANVKQVLSSADGGWYKEIAERGYNPPPFTADERRNWVFFPLFPLLVGAIATLVGHTTLVGVILSNLCFLGGLFVLRRYAERLGYNADEQSRLLWFVCLFPLSYFLSSPLTEGLFFLLLIYAWDQLDQGKLFRAGTAFALLTATRPTGLILLPAFAFALLQKKASPFQKFGALLLSPCGVGLYSLYLWFYLDSPFAFSLNQAAWGRNSQSFFGFLTTLLETGVLVRPWDFVALNLFITGLAVAAGCYFAKRHFDWLLVLMLPIGVSLSTGTSQSIGRFAAVLFPLFFALTEWTAQRDRFLLVVAISASLLTIMSLCYAFRVTAGMA